MMREERGEGAVSRRAKAFVTRAPLAHLIPIVRGLGDAGLEARLTREECW